MKLFSTYVKEMKIASRGFYFYIEIFVAFIALIILMFAVKENPDSKVEEYIFYDMSNEVVEYILDKEVEKGNIRIIANTELTIKPVSFKVLNKETGLEEYFDYKDEKTVTAKTFVKLNKETGIIKGTAYILDNKEDMIRLSNSTSNIGATIIIDESSNFFYEYYLQGYETERYSDVLYVLHTFSSDDIQSMLDKQVTREIGGSERLNNREAVIPVFIAFSGSLMGFFIIMSYIFLDKSQGIIKSFAVTPSSVWNYLLSKTFVILTTVMISSSIVVIPIMKLKPNYLLFYLFLAISSFAFSCLGLLVASFFDTISKAFGVLYLIMVGLMLPVFSYYISSFDPLWIRFLPTYPLLEGFKGIMNGQSDVAYILTYSLAFLIGGIILLALANNKFKKSLTV
jgi:hypothetical protein